MRWPRRARTSGLKPILAAKRDLFRTPLTAQELKAFDAVVFDPPRQGAETQAREARGLARQTRRRGFLQPRDLRS